MKTFLQLFGACPLLLLLNITQSFSQPGTLDSSFGVHGKVTTDFGAPQGAYAENCTLQSDGKIIVVGHINQYSTTSDFAVARYNSNGSLDSTFGINGKITTHFEEGVSASNASAVIIQSDGKIVVGGWLFSIYGQPGYFALARYKSNGTLDSSFGVNGKVLTNVSENATEAELFSLALQEDGKIIAVGNSDGFCVMRYLTNGNLDSTFGVNGKVEYRYVLGMVSDLAILKNGKIITIGYNGEFSSNGNFQVIQLLPNGNIDSTFGYNGVIYTDFYGKGDECYSMALLSTGDFVVAGSTFNSNNSREIAIAKYKANGNLDSSFGVNGKLTTALGETSANAHKLLIQQDGKLLIAGPVSSGNFMVARFKSNGTVDSSFGINGKALANFGTYATAYSASLQTDGKIVAVGNPPGFSLARFKGDELTNVSILKNISTLEGNSSTTPVTFKVVLNKASTQTIKVNYTTQDGKAKAGSDYVATSGTLTFRPGQVSKKVVVNVIGDNVVETNERFSLQLSNPQNAILGTLSTAACTIKNDDPSFVSAEVNENISSDKNVNITIYPNPVKDILKLEGLSANNKTTISVIDLQGKGIMKTATSNVSTSLNVKQLQTATYLVKIETNNTITTLKFVKE